jgi:hypothetical protein
LCHVNPTGCGMRNIYGAQYFAQNDLPAHKTAPDKVVKTNFSDYFSIGLDARTYYFYNEKSDATLTPFASGNKQSSLFQMEGNLYLNAQLTDRINLFLMKGIYSEFEIYGMANYLPYNGYIKVGTFQPSYGWRFQDHSSFVRDPLGWAPYYFDTGIEAGIYPDNISANVGIFNGIAGQVDNNRGKAVAGRFELRQNIDFFGLGVGGSYWHNDQTPNKIDMYGPFYNLKLLDGNLIYLGEFDWQKINGSDTTKLATTHSLSYQLFQGVWLEGNYDFYDPDTHFKSGVVKRYSFHLDYFPIAYLEIEPTARYYDDKILDSKYWNLLVQSHFFF